MLATLSAAHTATLASVGATPAFAHCPGMTSEAMAGSEMLAPRENGIADVHLSIVSSKQAEWSEAHNRHKRNTGPDGAVASEVCLPGAGEPSVGRTSGFEDSPGRPGFRALGYFGVGKTVRETAS